MIKIKEKDIWKMYNHNNSLNMIFLNPFKS